MEMFCRQCEQTFRGQGCDKLGVCGKTSEVSTLQDVLVYALKGLAVIGNVARDLNVLDAGTSFFFMNGIFLTVTNVNFDATVIEKAIYETCQIRELLKQKIKNAHQDQYGTDFEKTLPLAASFQPAGTRAGLLEQGRKVGIMSDADLNEDLRSLQEILLYGLKGMAAYADHAFRLGSSDPEVTNFLFKGMAALTNRLLSADELLGLILECGKANLRCMEILDGAHTKHFGHPAPNTVAIGYKKGPAIIVSGHDLLDLEQLLIATQGKGINIYTHGEMLPAFGYPELKKYPHLVGHFGSAWQNQQREFDNIPAAILMTTNCIQEPKASYADRIFTTNAVGWPATAHVLEANGKKDFSAVINKAMALGGFKEDKKEQEILVGFGHNAVLGVADKVIEAVKAGKVRRFFLIGGCDGAKPGRNYFTSFAEAVPADCIILTLACGKHRINRHDYGTVAGLPRLLDCGQCNDAYSAIVIAKALADAFKCGVNDLPLSFIVSWYEQKAVVILLTLLYLGIKNIRLGPTLPAFVSPNVLNILVEKFNIQPVKNVQEDLALALAGK